MYNNNHHQNEGKIWVQIYLKQLRDFKEVIIRCSLNWYKMKQGVGFSMFALEAFKFYRGKFLECVPPFKSPCNFDE